MGESLADLLHHGQFVGCNHVLGQVADGYVRRNCNRAGCGLLQTGYNFKHGRFSGAVFADKGYLVLVVDYIADVVEKRFCTELN